MAEGKSKRMLLWAGLGVLVLAGAVLAAVHFSGGQGARFKEIFGRNIQMARLVGRMRVNLSAAAEAEKAAVLAETDEASLEYAKQARESVAQVAAALAESKKLAVTPSPDADLLQRFEQAFAEYRKLDEEVLALAVQNTNLKAQALSFDQATAALARMEQALAPYLDAQRPASPAISPAAAQQSRLALRALAEALRIQAQHAPHITEKTEARMNELEARMAASDKLVRSSLAALAALAGQKGQAGQAGVGPALAAYEDFQKVTAEVLRLSRQNTNVRSLALTLDRKTKALAMCEEVLTALEEKVHADMAKATR